MIGQTLGHYRIESQLGAGGMGVVYRAHDTKLERTVAIKVVNERLSSEPKARDRLLREARTASALNHPHVCTVYEVGEADGQIFIVMEYVEGQPLSALLSEPRSNEMVTRYGIQVADALAHAHDRGIVHRDLKTSNVMITPEGRTKVLDFGLAKRLPAADLSEEPTRSGDSLTEAGRIVGTLHYLAPEVLRGQPADARTDIWALGVLLYELAMGDLPFHGKTRFEVYHAILGEAPTALSEDVPSGLRAVILRCLAKEPGQRYQRANEVRAALETVQSGSAVEVALPATSGRRRWLLWTAAGAIVLLAAFSAAKWLRGRDRGIQSIAVLPFTNQGGNAENEYVSDGIAESLIGSLSRLPNLKMIAFGSVLRYKGRAVDAAQVARELGVAAMVIGRVRQHRDGLSISAELIDARDGSRMWGDQYEARSGAFLSVQQEISGQISDQIRFRLSREERGAVMNRYAGNSEAYDLYLRGRYYYNKFTPEGYEKSLEFYRRAIGKDARYAPAYLGLGFTYNSMAWEGMVPPRESLEQLAAVTAKVQELDARLVHGLVAIKHGRERDLVAAEREWRNAIEVDPQDPIIQRFHAQFLRAQGRFDEAIAEMRRAHERDPLGVETNIGLGATYYWSRRYPEAIEQLNKTLEIDPSYPKTHELLAEVYARSKMYKESIGEWQKIFALEGDEESAQAIGQDFAAKGYDDVMRFLYQNVLDSLGERAKRGYVSPFAFAQAHAKRGDADQAFAWLDKAVEERAPWLTYIKTDPDFDALRTDPRFPKLLRRIGLPQ